MAAARPAPFALNYASQRGDLANVERLLGYVIGTEKAQEQLDGALLVASARGHDAVVECLITAGANVHADDDAARRAATAKGRTRVVERILAAGATLCVASGNGDLTSVERILSSQGCVSLADMDCALVAASRAGHLPLVERLLAAGANVHADGDEALLCASENGHVDVVECLLAAGATSNYALAVASEHGHLRVVERLLDAGANVHALNDRALKIASSLGHLAVVNRLLAAGANIHGDYAYALGVACRYGHLPVVERLLVAGADVHTSQGGALREASSNGHLHVVERLLSLGASSSEHEIALSLASANGHLRVVECLLADHAFDRASIHQALCEACKHGHVPVVDRLLATGIDFDSMTVDDPLVLACSHGHLSALERLLDVGAHHQLLSLSYALCLACKHGHLHIVERLLAAGVDVNASDGDGYRALCYASRSGQLHIVDYLFRSGADLDLERALKLSLQHGHPAVIKRLVVAGANPALIDWGELDASDLPRLMLSFPQCVFGRLTPDLQALWLRHHLRPKLRLQKILQRARDRLDRPPSTALESSWPTREALIAHLRTAGRRFARDYWVEGASIFFPEIEFGPVPEEFCMDNVD